MTLCQASRCLDFQKNTMELAQQKGFSSHQRATLNTTRSVSRLCIVIPLVMPFQNPLGHPDI